jgi:hypothetical protein
MRTSSEARAIKQVQYLDDWTPPKRGRLLNSTDRVSQSNAAKFYLSLD